MLLSLIFLIVLVAAVVGFVFRHEVSLGGCCCLLMLQSEFDAGFNPSAVAGVTGGTERWLGTVLSLAKTGLKQPKSRMVPTRTRKSPQGQGTLPLHQNRAK